MQHRLRKTTQTDQLLAFLTLERTGAHGFVLEGKKVHVLGSFWREAEKQTYSMKNLGLSCGVEGRAWIS